MFALVSLRIPVRRVSVASKLTRQAGGNPRWVSHTLTRSFIASVVRAEPASAKPNTTTNTKKLASKEERTGKTVKAKKKPAKKPTELIIPSSVKIPRAGLSPYIYFMTKIFKSELPRTRENFAEVSRACSEAWKALSEADKQKYIEMSKVARNKATQERQDYINTLEPRIIRELNRRRVAKGSNKIHQKIGYPPNGYVLWMQDYRSSHPGQFQDIESIRRLSQIWKGMSDEEKQTYVDRSKAIREEVQAQKNAEKQA